jgi:hypothetical protein
MILELKKISKYYQINKKETFYALKDINMSFP